jgi:hypothetical protein
MLQNVHTHAAINNMQGLLAVNRHFKNFVKELILSETQCKNLSPINYGN